MDEETNARARGRSRPDSNMATGQYRAKTILEEDEEFLRHLDSLDHPSKDETSRFPCGIEALLSEVARYYEEKVNALNLEVAALQTRAAEVQRETGANTVQQETARLQATLSESERERAALQTQLDQADGRIDALTNLYLASFTLHQQHDWETVLRALTDILVNQIGARSFEVMLLAPGGGFEPIIDQAEDAPSLNPEDIELLMESKEPRFSDSAPVAVAPLATIDGAIGIIIIYDTLEQKPRLSADDHNLLTTVSRLAATALAAARNNRGHESRNLSSAGHNLRDSVEEPLDQSSPAVVAPDTDQSPAAAAAYLSLLTQSGESSGDDSASHPNEPEQTSDGQDNELSPAKSDRPTPGSLFKRAPIQRR